MSLDYADLIMSLDDEFGLELHENEGHSHLAHEISTVGQLHARLVPELQKRGPVSSEAVWHKVCAIVGKVLHKNPATIRPEHRFIEDLGMN
jgi:acyl carrier protein